MASRPRGSPPRHPRASPAAARAGRPAPRRSPGPGARARGHRTISASSPRRELRGAAARPGQIGKGVATPSCCSVSPCSGERSRRWRRRQERMCSARRDSAGPEPGPRAPLPGLQAARAALLRPPPLPRPPPPPGPARSAPRRHVCARSASPSRTFFARCDCGPAPWDGEVKAGSAGLWAPWSPASTPRPPCRSEELCGRCAPFSRSELATPRIPGGTLSTLNRLQSPPPVQPLDHLPGPWLHAHLQWRAANHRISPEHTATKSRDEPARL